MNLKAIYENNFIFKLLALLFRWYKGSVIARFFSWVYRNYQKSLLKRMFAAIANKTYHEDSSLFIKLCDILTKRLNRLADALHKPFGAMSGKSDIYRVVGELKASSAEAAFGYICLFMLSFCAVLALFGNLLALIPAGVSLLLFFGRKAVIRAFYSSFIYRIIKLL